MNKLKEIVRRHCDAPTKERTGIALRNIAHERRKIMDNVNDLKIYSDDAISGVHKEDPISVSTNAEKVAKQCDIIIRHCQMLKTFSKSLWKAFEAEYSPK